MYNIKTIVIIIAVNVVKAEREHKHTDSEEQTEPHILTAANNRQITERRFAEASLGPLDDYESIEYDEIDNEHPRRFADEQNGQNDEDRNANTEEINTDDADEEKMPAIANGNNRKYKNDKNVNPSERKILDHHILVDTKGRSAAVGADQEDIKIGLEDMSNLNDPSISNHRPCSSGWNGICRSTSTQSSPSRSGSVNSYFAMLPRPGFLQPLYTVKHPLLQTNQQMTQPIIESGIYEEKETLPFMNSNAYAYQSPLTEVIGPNYQQGPNLDVLKKLIEATNAALTANGLVPHLTQNYPENLNPGGRLRRSTDIQNNPLVTIILPKGPLDKIPGTVNWGKINNLRC